MFKIVFKLSSAEADELEVFLAEKLNQPYTFRRPYRTIVVIENIPDKDTAYKIGEWIRHKKGFFYSVVGLDEKGRVIHRSWVKKKSSPSKQD